MPIQDNTPSGSPNPQNSGEAGHIGGLSGDITSPFHQDFIYNSYAGTDITAIMVLPGEGPIPLGELQTISYSIHRENTPVRLVGSTSPAGFVKGPRTIAGSLIFTVFDQYAFYRSKTFKDAILAGVFPLSDMLPPFDVVISMVNEYGRFSKMAIKGITIVDEGQTMSVDDLVTEQTYTYMARSIVPLMNYTPPEFDSVSDNDQITRNENSFFGGGVMRF